MYTVALFTKLTVLPWSLVILPPRLPPRVCNQIFLFRISLYAISLARKSDKYLNSYFQCFYGFCPGSELWSQSWSCRMQRIELKVKPRRYKNHWAIKVASTWCWRYLKTKVSLWTETHQMFSVHTMPEEFENEGFTLNWNASNVFRSHYARGIWKRRFHSELKRIKCFPFTLRQRNLKTEVSLSKRVKCFLSTQRRRKLNTKQSLVILDLYLSKTRAGKYIYRYLIVFERLRFQTDFCPHETHSRCFHVSPIWRVFSKCSVFVTD